MDTTTDKQKTPLILHGHFYQPPRENPRTGIIQKQLSASPWTDWNELITADCYRANCHSRYLDGYGSILSLSNNYEVLSFNFGPTLLNWLQAKDRQTYDLIIEADKASYRRLGYGNAIAQVYNHSILPLASRQDARTQILWGLDDFNRRFGRPAQGIWLSETAINAMVIDLLAEAGVEFVILSPWQCRAVEGGTKKLVSLDGKPAPYDRPFLLSGAEGGTISAFFYNPQLAEGISFGHYLRDADQLYGRLMAIKAKDRPALIHTATDGEIYGHHEPYGDMALAALAKKVEERGDFTFTNYGAYLASHPAVDRAILHDGEDGRGTSWSCFHGVSRWYKDCGCHTGGDESWNQKWRTPLRKAFDQLAQSIDEIYDREAAKLLGSVEAAHAMLNRFSPVASGLMSIDAFVSEYTQVDEHKRTLAALLRGQQYKHYAFTSCGWFFNDIAGLEPRQNIAYALRAVAYYLSFGDEELMMRLLATLAKAKANRKQDGTGETIANEELQQLSGEAEAALSFALSTRMTDANGRHRRYGHFSLLSAQSTDGIDTLLIEDTEALVSYRAVVGEESGEALAVTYHLSVTNLANGLSEEVIIDIDDIPLRMRDKLIDSIERRYCTLDAEKVRSLAKTVRHYSSLTRNVPYVSMGSLHQELVGATLATFSTIFSHSAASCWGELKEEYACLISFFLSYAKQGDRELLTSIFDRHIQETAHTLAGEPLGDEMAQFIIDFLALVRSHDIEPELRGLQEEIYPYLTGSKQSRIDEGALRTLAKALNFGATAGR